MATPIEYFFSTHSVYAYIGHRRLLEVASAAGRAILCRPFDLNALAESNGYGLTGGLTPARKAYFFGRDIERWADFRGVPILDHIPSNHSNDLTLSSTFLIAANQAGYDCIELAGEILRAHWINGADLADPATLVEVAARQNLDAAALLEAARRPEIIGIYEDNTREAIARQLFGSPTYFVDGDMFYGQDHLEMVARACEHAYEKRWDTEALATDRPVCAATEPR